MYWWFVVSIPFSRSTRSLRVDDFRESTVVLTVVLLFLIIWLAWFSLTRVTVYEVSESVQVTGENSAVATFSPAVLGRVRAGQPAQLRIDGFPWSQYGVVAAHVTRVRTDSIRDRGVRVELSLRPVSAPSIPLQPGMTGRAEIVVDRVSPAALVLRAAGKHITSRNPTGTAQTPAGVADAR